MSDSDSVIGRSVLKVLPECDLHFSKLADGLMVYTAELCDMRLTVAVAPDSELGVPWSDLELPAKISLTRLLGDQSIFVVTVRCHLF